MIYDFKCKKCEKVEEMICSYEQSQKGFKCSCGGKMSKLFPNKSNFQLKGNWYKTTKSY